MSSLWLRRNGVTGAFLVLDNTEEEGGRPGFYVRDYDPASYAAGNADLLLERGLPSVARENGVALDSYWSAFLTWMMRLRRKTNIFLHRCRRLPQWSRRTAAGNTFTTGAAGSG